MPPWQDLVTLITAIGAIAALLVSLRKANKTQVDSLSVTVTTLQNENKRLTERADRQAIKIEEQATKIEKLETEVEEWRGKYEIELQDKRRLTQKLEEKQECDLT